MVVARILRIFIAADPSLGSLAALGLTTVWMHFDIALKAGQQHVCIAQYMAAALSIHIFRWTPAIWFKTSSQRILLGLYPSPPSQFLKTNMWSHNFEKKLLDGRFTYPYIEMVRIISRTNGRWLTMECQKSKCFQNKHCARTWKSLYRGR